MNSINLIFLLLLTVIGVNAIDVSLTGFLYADTDPLYSELETRVNNYFQSQGKDIKLIVKFDTQTTSSPEPAKIAEAMENIIAKKNDVYKGADLYITDTVYTGRFAKHFEDLYERLPNDVIKNYEEGTATKTCIMNGRLAGLPYHIDYTVIMANQSLLDKYNKTAPQTWDELIETESFIYERETAEGRKGLHRYLAHFDTYENGPLDFLEFVHSYRDNVNDPFPSYTSDNAVEALEEMKKLRKSTNNEDDFTANDPAIMGIVTCTDFIFAKQFNIPPEAYMMLRNIPEMKAGCPDKTQFDDLRMYQLPGKKPGLSAAGIGGNNISMSRYISEEKKKAAAEILSFMLSYEQQKLNAIQYQTKSGIHALYREPEVCASIDCPFFSTMQGIVRPSSEGIDYNEYVQKVRNLVGDYIFEKNNKSAREILTEIDDIRRIHFIEALSPTGLTILGLTLLLFC